MIHPYKKKFSLTLVAIVISTISFSLVFLQIANATNLSQNLGGLWRLNEGAGSVAADSSGNGRNGVVTGATWTTGKLDNALSFNKTNRDYVQINGLIGSSTDVTVAAWANLSSIDTNGAEIISLGDHVAMRLDQNEVTPFTGVSFFYRHSAGWRATYGGTNYAGTGWHHFVYVINDTADIQKIYIDGAVASTSSYTESIQWTTQGTNTFIGRHGNGGTAYDFNGLIDDVRVYNVALTDSDIKSLYAAGPISGGSPSIKTRIKALLRFKGGIRFK